MRPKRAPAAEKPVLEFADETAWEAWLVENHTASSGVWLRLAKKGSGQSTLSRNEALDVALCYGWIDGQARPDNDDYWLQKFTPRGKRSLWSQINREKVAALIERGRMTPAGIAEVERAREDGRWEAAYEPPSRVTVPDDFQAALDGAPVANEFFTALDKQNRYAVLFRIATARKPETRMKRIQQFVDMLARGEKLYP